MHFGGLAGGQDASSSGTAISEICHAFTTSTSPGTARSRTSPPSTSTAEELIEDDEVVVLWLVAAEAIMLSKER